MLKHGLYGAQVAALAGKTAHEPKGVLTCRRLGRAQRRYRWREGSRSDIVRQREGRKFGLTRCVVQDGHCILAAVNGQHGDHKAYS